MSLVLSLSAHSTIRRLSSIQSCSFISISRTRDQRPRGISHTFPVFSLLNTAGFTVQRLNPRIASTTVHSSPAISGDSAIKCVKEEEAIIEGVNDSVLLYVHDDWAVWGSDGKNADRIGGACSWRNNDAPVWAARLDICT